MILVPLRTASGLNGREHWRVRHRRVKAERDMVRWYLNGHEKPSPPCVIVLTRVAPSNGLDDDNNVGALKAVRDEIADWLAIDDKPTDLVLYSYRQKRGEWGVQIDWESD